MDLVDEVVWCGVVAYVGVGVVYVGIGVDGEVGLVAGVEGRWMDGEWRVVWGGMETVWANGSVGLEGMEEGWWLGKRGSCVRVVGRVTLQTWVHISL